MFNAAAGGAAEVVSNGGYLYGSRAGEFLQSETRQIGGVLVVRWPCIVKVGISAPIKYRFGCLP